MSLSQALPFAKQFLGNPKEVGSLIPSSKRLAEKMLASIDFENAKTVIEYGPGTGAFTRYLAMNLPADAIFFGVEPNKEFQQHLMTQFPMMQVIPDYAENIFKHIDEKHKENTDLVISGLPFSLMPWETVKSTLNETYCILRKGGQFRTFIYNHTFHLPLCRKLVAELRQQYRTVEIHQVMRNFPPAKIIICTK